MRILLISDWPELHGGAEVYMLALRDALKRNGDQVQLLTSDVSPVAQQLADHVAFSSDQLLAKSVLQIVNPFAVASVRKVVRKFKPDVALVNMFALYLSPAAPLALGNVPYVLLMSDYKCICPLGHRLLPDRTICEQAVGMACFRSGCLPLLHWLRDQPRYALIRSVIKRASRVVSCGRDLQLSLEKQGILSTPLLLFSSEPSPAYRRDCANNPLFLYVGRLDEEKAVDTLIHAFSRLRTGIPEARLRVVGRGILREPLEELASELNQQDAIEFCGWMEHDDVEKELSRAWCLVAPSRWAEPFGLVALEAMLHGVPAIVTDAGGFSEQVEHGVTGLVFPVDDIETLTENMRMIATGEVFADHQIKPEAVSRVSQTFSVGSHVVKLHNIFAEAVLSGPFGRSR